MPLLDKLIRLTAKEFNLKRRLQFPKDSYLLVLKRNGRTQAFDVLETFAGKKADFLVYWSNYRSAMTFEIARSGDEITAPNGKPLAHNLSIATHVSFNGDVFATELGDEIKPFFVDATWKIFGRATGDRFAKP